MQTSDCFIMLPRSSGALLPTTDVMDTYVYRQIRLTGDFGAGSAAGFIQSVVGFVLVLLSNFAVKKYDRRI